MVSEHPNSEGWFIDGYASNGDVIWRKPAPGDDYSMTGSAFND